MSDTAAISYFIQSTYTINQINVFQDLFNALNSNNKLEELNELLIEYFDSLPAGSESTETKIGMEKIIVDYANDNIIVPELSIIINKHTGITMSFILGIVLFYTNLKIYNPIITPEVLKILNNGDELVEVIIGEIINTYCPEYNAIDALDNIDTVDDYFVAKYAAIVEDTIESAEVDPSEIHDLVVSITSIDSALINTRLFNYIVNNSAYYMSDAETLDYINHIAEVSSMTDEDLAKELLVYSITNSKSLEAMIELVDSVYDEHNTQIIADYLKCNVRSQDEDNS